MAAFVVSNNGDDPTSGSASSSPGGRTGGDFHSLVVDPANPQRLFVGGHQAVAVSDDGVRTWRAVASLDNADAMGWAFAADAIYVSGHPGLNRSTDGGTTFERVNDGLPNTDVHAFGAGGDVLYGASPGAGVFASTQGIGAWQVRTTSAGQAFFGRIVVDPSDPDHLLAADAQAGVGESRDGGTTWSAIEIGLPAATWMSAGGDGLDVLVASGPAGAAVSRDQGDTWQPLQLPNGASLVEVSPADANVFYAGAHDGERVQVYVSRDGGRTWTAP